VAKQARCCWQAARRRLFAMHSDPKPAHTRSPAPALGLVARPTALLAALLCGACMAGAAPGTPPLAPGQAPAGTLLLAIRAEIGDAACDTDAQCRTVGVGSRPCGGPEAYLAWSSQPSRAPAPKTPAAGDRAERLQALVAQHREARRLEHERSGVLSDCRFSPDPGAVCRPRASDNHRVCLTLGAAPRAGVVGAP
jgi:hypothetical protein